MQSDAEHDATPFNMDEGSSNSARTCANRVFFLRFRRLRGPSLLFLRITLQWH